MLRIVVLLVLLVFLFLGAAIGYFNAQEVEFDFLAGSIHLPLIALLVATFLLAVILTLLICFGRMLGLRTEIRSLRKRLSGAEAELKSLRELPLQPQVQLPAPK